MAARGEQAESAKRAAFGAGFLGAHKGESEVGLRASWRHRFGHESAASDGNRRLLGRPEERLERRRVADSVRWQAAAHNLDLVERGDVDVD